MTALNRIANRCKDAVDQSNKARDSFKDLGGESCANRLGYHEGQASAYNEAHIEVKALLARLQNRFQNGCLNIDDFQ